MNTTPKLIASIWFATSVVLGLAGCGTVNDDERVSCTLDAPGETFTFRVVNTGAREFFLPYDCGKNYPIDLDTPHGMLGLANDPVATPHG